MVAPRPHAAGVNSDGASSELRRCEHTPIWVALLGNALGPALGATPLRAQQPALTREELEFGQVAFAEAVQGPADVRVMRVTLPPGAAVLLVAACGIGRAPA